MALIIKDRVKETTTTTGTGSVTLAGASTGFRSFADIGNANTTYYCISGGSQFEVGIGTYTASGTTLSRDTVLSNSLGTTAKISFSAGSKDVFCTYPSGVSITNSSIATPYITSSNTNNVGIGNNSLNGIGAGVATVTQLTAGSGYDSGYDGSGAALVYVSGTPIIAGGVAPIVTVFINGDGTINSVSIQSAGFGWTALDTVFTLDNADLGGVGSGATFRIASLSAATNNTAIGYLAGTQQKVGSNSVYVGYSSSGTGSNQVLVGSNLTGYTQDNIVVIGDTNITNTTLRGNVTATQFTGIGSFTNLTANGSLNLTGNAISAASFATSTTGSAISIGTALTGGSLSIGSTGQTGAINMGRSNSSGTINIGGTAGTGAITLGQSTASQAVNIATGANTSGTKTLNLGTAGGVGGTTAITIGTTAGTSTTTINGALVTTALADTGSLARSSGLTSLTTINATTTYTTGGITLPSQTAAAGSVWRIRAYGQYLSVNSATARNAQIACFWGSTQLTALTVAVGTSLAQTSGFLVEFELTATSTTAIWTTGQTINRIGSSTTNNNNIAMVTGASTTVTAGAQTLDLRFSMSNASMADEWRVSQVTIERFE